MASSSPGPDGAPGDSAWDRLDAWLLPALSRQWDDRQKAQQLKTAIVSEMASGSARALIGGEALWAGRKVDEARVLDAWAVESLMLETRLRAYFGQKIVTAWEIYSWLVDRWNGAHRGKRRRRSSVRRHRPSISIQEQRARSRPPFPSVHICWASGRIRTSRRRENCFSKRLPWTSSGLTSDPI